MADKRIQDLTPATSVGTSDRFVLEQSGQAKSLTGQILINDLATALDGHGGISDISYTAPSSGSLTGTLSITLADNTVETFSVTNGKGIASIADKWAVSDSDSTEPSTWYNAPQTMTVTDRYEWHYQTITFNDGTTMDTDAAVVGVYGDTGDADHVYIKWADAYPTQDADMLNYPSNYIGLCTTIADTAPAAYTDYEWFLYKGETGDTGTGIVSVTLDSTSGLVDTYKVLFDDNTYTTFNVTNGSNIASIAKTNTSGLVDTYTVTLTNGDATTFNVVNAKSISSITNVDVTHVAGHTDVYRINFNDGDTFSFSVYNGTNGSGSVSTVDNIPSDNQNVPLLILGSNAPTTSTVGVLKQRYFDQTNSNLYICTGIDTSGAEATYTWQGASSITVDSALSTQSTNPVQNAVLTTLLGTTQLQTTAQTLTGAVNELDAEIGSTALPTTAQTLTGAIAEHETDLSGKVSKSGDTMTGGLKITGITNQPSSTMLFHEDTYSLSNLPSSTAYRYLFTLEDSAENVLGDLQAYLTAAGRTGISLYAINKHNNSTVTNGVTLAVNADGTKSIVLTDADVWRFALGLGTSGALPITIAQGGTGATANPTGIVNLGGKAWKSFQVTSSSSKTVSFSGSSGMGYFVVSVGNNANYMGAYLIYTSNGSTATPIVKTISSASYLTITPATGKVTITSSASSTGTLFFECLSATAYNNMSAS